MLTFTALRVERDNHPRRGGVPRPRAHADFDTAQILCFGDSRIPQRQVLADDLPEMGQRQIQVPKQRILVQGVLRRHGRQKRRQDRRIHQEPAEGGPSRHPAVHRLRRQSVQRIASKSRERRSVLGATARGGQHQRAISPENEEPPDFLVGRFYGLNQ